MGTHNICFCGEIRKISNSLKKRIIWSYCIHNVIQKKLLITIKQSNSLLRYWICCQGNNSDLEVFASLLTG